MSFTTVEDVNTFLNRETLTPAQTTTITALIRFVDGVINNYCGWDMLAKNYVGKLYSGTGDSELDLGVYPITALTEVLVYTDTSYTDPQDYTSGAFLVEDEGIIISTQGNFNEGRYNVKVSFTAGYDEANVPEDLKYAASYLVALEFTKIDKETIGVAEQKFNNLEEKFDGNDLPVLVKRVLDRYRKILVL